MPAITVSGMGVVFDGRRDETLVDTIARAGYSMRIGCRRGGCGLCRVRVESGRFHLNATVSSQVLPESERDQGVTLACRMVPDGDVVVGMPDGGKFQCVAPMLARLAGVRCSDP